MLVLSCSCVAARGSSRLRRLPGRQGCGAPFAAKLVHDKRSQQEAGQLSGGCHKDVAQSIRCQDEVTTRATRAAARLRVQLRRPGGNINQHGDNCWLLG